MRIHFNQPSKNKIINSSAFDNLHNKTSPGVEKQRPNLIQKHKALNDLFRKEISTDQSKKILMIWGMTLYACGMTEKINVSEDEDVYLNGISKSIEGLKKDLIGWVRHGTTFQINSLILGKEPHVNRYIDILDQLAVFVTTCRTNKKFGNGAQFSPGYIKKYGVFSLFHLGNTLGLEHTKRNSHLVTFVELITDLEKQQIYKYYKQYNEAEFQSIYKDNALLSFIDIAYRAILDPSANLRYPAHFITNYSSNLIVNSNQWC